MNTIPHTIPISDLRFQQSDVLTQVEDAPIVLTKQGRAVAVLVDPDYWNQVIAELDDLTDALAIAQAKLAIANGEEELIDWETAKAELQQPSSTASNVNGL